MRLINSPALRNLMRGAENKIAVYENNFLTEVRVVATSHPPQDELSLSGTSFVRVVATSRPEGDEMS